VTKPILVPVDSSPLDESALRYATALAEANLGPVHLVRAVPAVPATALSGADVLSLAAVEQVASRREAQRALSRVAATLRRRGVAAHVHVRFGPPAEVIHETSREIGAGLLVLATRGLGGIQRAIEGSVADQVLRWADVPVLLVRQEHARMWPRDQRLRMLVALDGSPFAEAVLAPAVEFAQLLGADVLLAHVVHGPHDRSREGLAEAAPELEVERVVQDELASKRSYVESVAAGLPAGIRVSTRVGLGRSPAEALVQLTREEQVDVVALATHGRGGLARVALGSVATAMLQTSPVPLLVVRVVSVWGIAGT
jgi:nucleotide-binding universal stress UspA family protein